MKHLITSFLLIILLGKCAFSQTIPTRIIVGGGPSLNGSGDLSGYIALNEINVNIGKRFFLSPGFYFSNHSQRYQFPNFEFRHVIAGINVFTNINVLFLNNKHHSIAFGAGPVLRIQNESAPSNLGEQLGRTGQREVFYIYQPSPTTTFGYNVAPAYYYKLSRKLSLGAKFILQNDTEGNIITSEMLFVGVNLIRQRKF